MCLGSCDGGSIAVHAVIERGCCAAVEICLENPLRVDKGVVVAHDEAHRRVGKVFVDVGDNWFVAVFYVAFIAYVTKDEERVVLAGIYVLHDGGAFLRIRFVCIPMRVRRNCYVGERRDSVSWQKILHDSMISWHAVACGDSRNCLAHGISKDTETEYYADAGEDCSDDGLLFAHEVDEHG